MGRGFGSSGRCPPPLRGRCADFLEKQAEAGNPDRQREGLLAAERERGSKVVTVVPERASGLNEKRRGLRKRFRRADRRWANIPVPAPLYAADLFAQSEAEKRRIVDVRTQQQQRMLAERRKKRTHDERRALLASGLLLHLPLSGGGRLVAA